MFSCYICLDRYTIPSQGSSDAQHPKPLVLKITGSFGACAPRTFGYTAFVLFAFFAGLFLTSSSAAGWAPDTGPLFIAAQEIQSRHAHSGLFVKSRELSAPTESDTIDPLRFGSMVVRTGWTQDGVTGEDALAAHISFDPDAQKCPQCGKIRLVQVARVLVNDGTDYIWTAWQSDRNRVRTEDGFYVDFDAHNCAAGAPCSPYYRDHWPLSDESQDGRNLPDSRAPASLADYPHGWLLMSRIELETCARCVETGQFLGCVSWGASWPTSGNRTLLPHVATDGPSPRFLKALERFDSFYLNAPSPSS